MQLLSVKPSIALVEAPTSMFTGNRRWVHLTLSNRAGADRTILLVLDGMALSITLPAGNMAMLRFCPSTLMVAVKNGAAGAYAACFDA